MRVFILTAALVGLAALGLASPAMARRPIPNTDGAIHVWNDQLPDDMTAAQVSFEAGHVDGTQKVSLHTAKRIRTHHPGFLVLHYRLAIGDGPVPFRIGDRWASDYGSVRHHSSWFWHEHGRRVLNKPSDWYLMNPVSGWRKYWARRVLHEARLLGDDGVFADSLSVPQYLGADNFSPPLHYFVGERAWTRRIDRFMRFEKRRLHGRLWFIPNAGSWITTRDRTDYGIPDGVMIEGYAEPGGGSWYATSDWRLQMNRVLSLVRRRRIVIAQCYPAASDVRARMFALGSYLLTKGTRSFINLDIGITPQWFPEYGIDLGSPRARVPSNIGSLRTAAGLYARRFAHGVVVVNPGETTATYSFSGRLRLVEPHGGGALPADASTSGWGLRGRAVSGSLPLPPHSAAVLKR
ncbi:MAG: putative glycoside hydrolase [Solirubrobacteraceae bacterium]